MQKRWNENRQHTHSSSKVVPTDDDARRRRLKDGYLLENCLAVLVNVAPQVEHLPPYAAQRLISVLVASSKKWIAGATAAAAREQQQVEQLPPGNGGLQIPPSQGGRGEVVGSGVAAGGGVPEEGVVDDGDAGVEGLSDIQVKRNYCALRILWYDPTKYWLQ